MKWDGSFKLTQPRIWDILVEEAKCLEHTCQEYKEHQERNGDTSSMPSYSNLALNVHDVRRGRFKGAKPSKGKQSQGQSLQSCQYSKHHADKAYCPVIVKVCRNCGRPNHYQKMCRGAKGKRQWQGGDQGQYPRSKSPERQAKPKEKRKFEAHTIVQNQVTEGWVQLPNTVENLVLKEISNPAAVMDSKMILERL